MITEARGSHGVPLQVRLKCPLDGVAISISRVRSRWEICLVIPLSPHLVDAEAVRTDHLESRVVLMEAVVEGFSLTCVIVRSD